MMNECMLVGWSRLFEEFSLLTVHARCYLVRHEIFRLFTSWYVYSPSGHIIVQVGFRFRGGMHFFHRIYLVKVDTRSLFSV